MNLFEGIPNHIIEKTLLNIKLNLDNVGLYGGHTIRKHVSKSEEELLNRLNENSHLKKVTTFKNERIAEKSVVMTMKLRYNEIVGWLLSGSEELRISAKCQNTDLGYGFTKYKNEKVFSREAVVILVKDERANWGFRIKTAYPQI